MNILTSLSLTCFTITVAGLIWVFRYASKNNNLAINNASAKPLRWYYFYTYIRLPFTILVMSSQLPKILQHYNHADPWVVVIGITILIFTVFLYYGLAMFKHWAWYANVVVLIVESFISTTSIAARHANINVLSITLTLTAVLVMWFLPNYVYFDKRYHLFVN